GWTVDSAGRRRWGRYGAAGLLLRAPGASGPLVLLQHRAQWSHHGGTWGLPGGARDSDESAVSTAVREAGEEAGVRGDDVAVRAERVTTPGDSWSYTTVVADAAAPLALQANAESAELRWVAEDEVVTLPLHPSFAQSWPLLRARPLILLLDTANVLGSRPDGWWRDRAGASRALLAQVVSALPRTAGTDNGFVWLHGVEAVIEGAARDVTVDGVVAHRAPGSGDDELVRVVGPQHLVVTADRGLRARLPAGIPVCGPGWVRAWLPDAEP
ncbi:MAG: NUDIX hydrolase, partial [Mycobacteriaceae bacterium]